jgi:hypothetical protein
LIAALANLQMYDFSHFVLSPLLPVILTDFLNNGSGALSVT